MAKQIRTVNIRPGVSVLSVLQHLNYRAWFALAEFVDNSLQSYLTSRAQLEAAEGGDFKLKVSIDIDAAAPARIVIRDNAGGIAQQDFPRAFRPAEIPPDATGLSEFGMGMKSAACWFGRRWHVRTSALGEPFESVVRFDIDSIVANHIDELNVETTPCPANQHFTEVVLEELHANIAPRTLGKIREHLRDIYRCYLRSGTLSLKVNGAQLSYQEPEVLVAPYYREMTSSPVRWRKEIDLDLGGGQIARGFAALRSEGKGAEAGFALFRRNRLIHHSREWR